ncbi:hypothetical protein NL676_019654 [Syzygium grande]|nr:hypothetical protein NL676_019654 [Syzygium grande]
MLETLGGMLQLNPRISLARSITITAVPSCMATHPRQPMLKEMNRRSHSIARDVSLGLELEGFVPHSRVSTKAYPAQEDVAALEDVVARHNRVRQGNVRDIEGHKRVEPEGLPSTCLDVVELGDIGLLD